MPRSVSATSGVFVGSARPSARAAAANRRRRGLHGRQLPALGPLGEVGGHLYRIDVERVDAALLAPAPEPGSTAKRRRPGCCRPARPRPPRRPVCGRRRRARPARRRRPDGRVPPGGCRILSWLTSSFSEWSLGRARRMAVRGSTPHQSRARSPACGSGESPATKASSRLSARSTTPHYSGARSSGGRSGQMFGMKATKFQDRTVAHRWAARQRPDKADRLVLSCEECPRPARSRRRPPAWGRIARDVAAAVGLPVVDVRHALDEARERDAERQQEQQPATSES